MDLLCLAVILQAALSPNPNERKAAEQSLEQMPSKRSQSDKVVVRDHILVFVAQVPPLLSFLPMRPHFGQNACKSTS
ncbi:hypothetical protein K1719_024219 [Acacia pycnantha]|nr:hypothetical protein K1719_024219 [Acacia pycnantha]